MKYLKSVFESLDSDGYKIIDRKKLVDALNESDRLRDIMDKPAVLKPKITSSSSSSSSLSMNPNQ